MIYQAEGLDESFHILIDIKRDMISRWGVFENVTQETQGFAGDGTSIDHDEPFVIRFECDQDGWMLKVNDEPKYQTFFHLFSSDQIRSVRLEGQADINYVGFGERGERDVIVLLTLLLLQTSLRPLRWASI